jgi:hypothetical protein
MANLQSHVKHNSCQNKSCKNNKKHSRPYIKPNKCRKFKGCNTKKYKVDCLVIGDTGHTGEKGDMGSTGEKGDTGSITFLPSNGSTGDTGSTGEKGNTGADGALSASRFQYKFDGSTGIADPGFAKLSLNAFVVEGATHVSINQYTGSIGDIEQFLLTINSSLNTIKGHIKISSYTDLSNFVYYAINNITDNIGWIDIDVSYITGDTGIIFQVSEDLDLCFARTGERWNW